MNFMNIDEEEEVKQEDIIDIKQEDSEKPVEKGELDFNKANREASEKLMEEASTNKDGYWDSNNLFVRILLLVLGIIIVVGAIYYIVMYMFSR